MLLAYNVHHGLHVFTLAILEWCLPLIIITLHGATARSISFACACSGGTLLLCGRVELREMLTVGSSFTI